MEKKLHENDETNLVELWSRSMGSDFLMINMDLTTSAGGGTRKKKRGANFVANTRQANLPYDQLGDNRGGNPTCVNWTVIYLSWKWKRCSPNAGAGGSPCSQWASVKA